MICVQYYHPTVLIKQYQNLFSVYIPVIFHIAVENFIITILLLLQIPLIIVVDVLLNV